MYCTIVVIVAVIRYIHMCITYMRISLISLLRGPHGIGCRYKDSRARATHPLWPKELAMGPSGGNLAVISHVRHTSTDLSCCHHSALRKRRWPGQSMK